MHGGERVTEIRPEITEQWLRDTGFKWHEWDTQNTKQWVLWLGDAIQGGWQSFEDLGVEVCNNLVGREEVYIDWFCWIRADTSHRYSRFLHVRHIRYVDELVRLIEGLKGQDFDPKNVLYGSLRTAKSAERIRAEDARLDLRILKQSHPWRDTEKDESRGRPLVEHVEGAIEGKKAK